jgi:large subunit ribosomal protein L15
MDLSTLKPAPGSRHARKRVGRGKGTGHGKTSGRGHKGQKARSGYSRPAGFEGGQLPLHRRVPKRGFNHQKRYPMAVINVDSLNQCFEAGAEVTTQLLIARGLVHDKRGGVKLLGRGEVAHKLIVKIQAVSPSAKQKIEAAGGTVELVPMPSNDAEVLTAAEGAAAGPEE